MRNITSLILILLTLGACKEPFIPEVDLPPTGYLVVEGDINIGKGETVIKLSRTSLLDRLVRAEKAAEVQIVGEDLSTYPLTGNEEGVYTSGILNLPKQRYRLRIKTGGKEYLSALLEEKPTPSIDSVTWQRDATRVKLYVHTHDDANKTKYYKWAFEETWEIHADYEAFYKFKTVSNPRGRDVTYVVRTTPKEQESFFYCWKTKVSNEILLGSTAKLEKDIIIFPIKFIPQNDERLVYLYSINVTQTALDIERYNFYKNLKDNTENNGSIFDRQPSEIKSNIRCVNAPDEIVIGNVMATSPQEKRIFIKNLPAWGGGFICNPNTAVMLHNTDTLFKYNGPHIPLSVEESSSRTPLHPDSASKYIGYAPYLPTFAAPFPYITGYSLVNKICVDCTEQGGRSNKPSFWPQ